MNKATLVLGAVLAFSAPLVLIGGALLPSVAVAQQKIGPKVGVPLKAAQDAVKAKQWKTAEGKIKEANAVQPKSAYEQYAINELLWYVYLQQGRNADAARVLEQQIASGQMSAGERTQRTKTLSQLYFRAGNFGKATQVGNQYLKSVPGDKDIQLLVAQAFYQQKDYQSAAAAGEKLLKASGTPDEDTLQLVLRSYYELGDADGTSRTLEQLLKYYPSPDTWHRVLDGYLDETKHDHELVALYRLSEDVGALTKAGQYVDMTQALVVGGFGIEGQRIMQKGIDAGLFKGEELTRAQRTLEAAKRKADAERQAIGSAGQTLAAATTGDQMYEVGKLYFSAGDYAKAADAFSKAIAKGGLSDLDDANMELGIALVRSGKKAEALKAFDAVKDPKFAEVARLWKLRAR
jgi:tetratricopeptide (TPR) repeat protein